MALNLLGSREAARLQVALVMSLLALMAFYVVLGLPAVDTAYPDPVAPRGLSAVVFTAGFVFVAYGGLLKVSSISEEVRNPGVIIPKAMMLALVVVTACYTLMVLVTTGVLPGEALDRSLTPISDGAATFMGTWGAGLMGVAAFLAFVTTANAGIMAASRYLLALGRDELAPAFLKAINRRFQTPHNAIAVTGFVMSASLFLDLGTLVEAASTVLILSYTLSCLCVVILRESRLQNYRPQFRAPLYPWLQILGAAGFAVLIFAMGAVAFLISLLLVAAGFLTYWFYGRAAASREYALLHLAQRITSREIVTGTLESELKEIIRERDEIIADRFDELIEDCPVLDLRDSLSRDAFFGKVGEAMGPRLGIAPERLSGLLTAREEEGSTAVAPGLAIPHIVVDETIPFDILIARSRQGIPFSPEAPGVKAIIVLVGSEAERSFHLRCLAAIAQIAQAPDFQRRWLAASGERALRDLFLLGERPRG